VSTETDLLPLLLEKRVPHARERRPGSTELVVDGEAFLDDRGLELE